MRIRVVLWLTITHTYSNDICRIQLELNASLIYDIDLYKELSGFEPHKNVPDMSTPFNVSGNLSLMATATSIMSNYLYDKKDKGVDTLTKVLHTVEVAV